MFIYLLECYHQSRSRVVGLRQGILKAPSVSMLLLTVDFLDSSKISS